MASRARGGQSAASYALFASKNKDSNRESHVL